MRIYQSKSKIKNIKAREILDSKGNPTVEVELETNLGKFSASVPSGTSTGKYEAFELRDGGKRYGGKGVLKAVKNVNEIIGPALKGKNVSFQEKLDKLMIDLDDTENKFKLGANAILPVSIAICRAGATANNLPLYKYIFKLTETGSPPVLPRPAVLLIEGGLHAGNQLDFQEFMIVPEAGPRENSFKEGVRKCVEIYHNLGLILEKELGNTATNVGYEGGFAATGLCKSEEAMNLIIKAIKEKKYEGQLKIAIDAAASSFYGSGKYNFEGKELTREEILNFYSTLSGKYPIIFIEDPFEEEDFEGFKNITEKLGKEIIIIGDDFLVTNPEKIKKAIKENYCNGLVLKPNQIGTITETLEAAKLAVKKKWKIMVSHRSGETCDDFIADLAVGIGADFIKAGAPTRGERTSKYNRLLKIEEEILTK